MDAIKKHFREQLREPANRDLLIDALKRLAVVRSLAEGPLHPTPPTPTLCFR